MIARLRSEEYDTLASLPFLSLSPLFSTSPFTPRAQVPHARRMLPTRRGRNIFAVQILPVGVIRPRTTARRYQRCTARCVWTRAHFAIVPRHFRAVRRRRAEHHHQTRAPWRRSERRLRPRQRLPVAPFFRRIHGAPQCETHIRNALLAQRKGLAEGRVTESCERVGGALCGRAKVLQLSARAAVELALRIASRRVLHARLARPDAHIARRPWSTSLRQPRQAHL